MANYIKLYDKQGIPVGFTECTEDVESALGDARVKLYDEQQRLVGFRVEGGEGAPYFITIGGTEGSSSIVSQRFGPFVGYGNFTVNIPESVTALSVIDCDWPAGSAYIDLRNNEGGYVNIYYNEDELQWWIDDGDIINGECTLSVRKA